MMWNELLSLSSDLQELRAGKGFARSDSSLAPLETVSPPFCETTTNVFPKTSLTLSEIRLATHDIRTELAVWQAGRPWK